MPGYQPRCQTLHGDTRPLSSGVNESMPPLCDANSGLLQRLDNADLASTSLFLSTQHTVATTPAAAGCFSRLFFPVIILVLPPVITGNLCRNCINMSILRTNKPISTPYAIESTLFLYQPPSRLSSDSAALWKCCICHNYFSPISRKPQA